MVKKLLFFLSLVLIPLLSVATIAPKSECPKKDKDKTDSLAVAEEEEAINTNTAQFEQKLGIGQEDFMVNNPSSYIQDETIIEEAQEDTNSALSFNIVYYIFEKFKFSSAVDPQ